MLKSVVYKINNGKDEYHGLGAYVMASRKLKDIQDCYIKAIKDFVDCRKMTNLFKKHHILNYFECAQAFYLREGDNEYKEFKSE